MAENGPNRTFPINERWMGKVVVGPPSSQPLYGDVPENRLSGEIQVFRRKDGWPIKTVSIPNAEFAVF